MRALDRPSQVARPIDPDSSDWLARLAAHGPVRDAAIAELHAVLAACGSFRAAAPRPVASRRLRGNEYEDLAQQAADDALVAILGKLGDFRGDSRFTTWAYKFVLYEAASTMRKRAWQGREIPLESEAWLRFADLGSSPHGDAEMRELFAALGSAIEQDLTRSSARCCSRSRSTTCRSTSSPSASAPRAAPSTRRSTTRARSSAPAWPRAG